jgi:hypothetical protein
MLKKMLYISLIDNPALALIKGFCGHVQNLSAARTSFETAEYGSERVTVALDPRQGSSCITIPLLGSMPKPRGEPEAEIRNLYERCFNLEAVFDTSNSGYVQVTCSAEHSLVAYKSG